MTETVLTNARIVLSDSILHGSVLIREGRIADISDAPTRAGEDLDGDLLLPA